MYIYYTNQLGRTKEEKNATEIQNSQEFNEKKKQYCCNLRRYKK